MSTRDSKTPLKKRLKDLFGGRSAASLAPSPTQSTAAVQPPKPEYVAHRTRAPPSIATDPHTPPSNSLVADAPATRASTDGGANDVQEPTTASPLEKGFKPPEEHGAEDPASATTVNAQTTRDSTDKGDRNAQEPATASLHEKSSNPPDEHGPKELTFDTSHKLWNAAYDDLEKDEAELVGSYVKVLERVLCSEASKDPASDVANVAAELKDPSQRQIHMQKLVKEGKAKIARASKITKAVGDFVGAILEVKPMVDLAIQGIPQAAPAALPWAGVCVGLQILSNPAKATKSNLAGIAHVVSRMEWYCALTEHLLNRDNIKIRNESFGGIIQQLEERLISLYKALLLYQMKSVCSYYRHQGLVFLRSLANWYDWDADLKTVTDAEDSLQRDSDQYDKLHGKSALAQLVKSAEGIEQLLGDIRQDIRQLIDQHKADNDEKCLQDLYMVDPQDDMEKIEKNKDKLLDGAYKWILDTEEYAAFTNWSKDVSNQPSCQLMWIKGHAGTGKTMLLIGVIHELYSQSAKLAPGVSHFFCQGTDADLNNATATLRSLIWLLLIQQPHLIPHVRSKYKNAGPSLFQGDTAFIALSNMFKSMLEDPGLSSVYFVIDALDECEQGLPDLIKLISTSLSLSEKVKWLVSSRPIVVELTTPDTVGSLVELDTQKLRDPVNAYINDKLSAFEGKPGYTKPVLDDVAAEVLKRAENTFLWVWFVFRELGKTNQFGKLKVNGKDALATIKDFPSGLSSLYGRIMAIIDGGQVGYPQYCKNVLVAATLALRPLTLSELAILADLPHDMPWTITEDCGSFLTITGETVYLIHQSAKDYLEANFKSRLQPAGVAQGHMDISRRSIDAMSAILKQNMYDLDFGFKPRDMKPPQLDLLAPIQYSCVFWADHLCSLNGESPECKTELMDDGRVFRFLKERFLRWLESLSLLGKLSDGVQSIRKLLHIAQLQAGASPQLIGFLNDAEKFVRSHGSIIERAPLQTYGSALVFSPTTSEVNQAQWKERLPFINMVAGIRDHWDAHQQTLEGHSDAVWAVAFSPDGKTLASASYDRTVRLWDAATGAHQQTLKGHSGGVGAVAFSPDGKTLASASHDRTVRLWDAATGAHQQTLEGHSGTVGAVAFSLDGKTLASASDDRTVQLWDAATGAHQQTLEGHSSWVWAVAFSLDGKTLASASHDRTVQLWDAATGAHQQTLKGHSDAVWAVAFSLDGKTLASASHDRTVRLWDAATGAHQQTLEGHGDAVWAVAFSLDGKTLASASADCTVRLWDAATGAHQQTLEGHSSWVGAVAFSSDGKTLASALHNRTVRLWDAATGAHQQTLKGHSGRVGAVAFSPDGKTLASASNDHTVRLWDAATGAHQQTIKTNQILSNLVFSEDGQYLKTTYGSLRLSLKSALLGKYPEQRPSDYALFVDDEWVTLDRKNLLWLPKDYRPTCVAVYGGTLVLGHRSGGLTFLQCAIS